MYLSEEHKMVTLYVFKSEHGELYLEQYRPCFTTLKVGDVIELFNPHVKYEFVKEIEVLV